MPRGYERVDCADTKDEHGLPVYEPGSAHVGPAPSAPPATVPEAETVVRVTVSTGGAAGASTPLYYGATAGLATPLGQNQIVERDVPTPAAVASAAVGVAGAPAVVVAALPPAAVIVAGAGAEPLVAVVPPVATSVDELRATLQARVVEFEFGRYFRESYNLVLRHNKCRTVTLSLLMLAAFILTSLFVAAIPYAISDGEYRGRRYRFDAAMHSSLWDIIATAPLLLGVVAALFEAIATNSRICPKTLWHCYSLPYWARLATITLLLAVPANMFLRVHHLIVSPFEPIVASLVLLVTGVLFAFPLHMQHRDLPLRFCTAARLSATITWRYVRGLIALAVCSLVLLAIVIAVSALLLSVAWRSELWALNLLLTALVWAFFSGPALVYVLGVWVSFYHHAIGINGARVMVPASLAAQYEAINQQRRAQAAAAAAVQLQPLAVAMPVVAAPVAALPMALPVALPVAQPLALPPADTRVVVVVRPSA